MRYLEIVQKKPSQGQSNREGPAGLWDGADRGRTDKRAGRMGAYR